MPQDKPTVRDIASRLSFGFILKTQPCQRQKSLAALRKTFKEVRKYPDMHLDPKFLLNLPINIDMGTLSVDADTEKTAPGGDTKKSQPCSKSKRTMPDPTSTCRESFVPLSEKFLARHNLNKPPRGPVISHASSSTQTTPDSTTIANQLRELAYPVAQWHREVLKTRGIHTPPKLCNVAEECFAKEFSPYLINETKPIFQCQWHYASPDSSHIKVSVANTTTGDPSALLQSELLTIIAAIFTRILESDAVEHVVIPVLMISFMAPQHARIIVAAFDCRCRRMAVSMSPLLSAWPWDRASWTLFRRYLGSTLGSPSSTV